MSLPVRPGECGGVDGVLRFDFGADDVGNIEKNENGENEYEEGDQRENQHLSAFFPECFHTVSHGGHSVNAAA